MNEEGDPLASLWEQHPRSWAFDDNRDGFEGLVSVFDANGRSILCTGDMEDCTGADIQLARVIAALPALLELTGEVAQEYPDAADWKDARGRLYRMASAALQEARLF